MNRPDKAIEPSLLVSIIKRPPININTKSNYRRINIALY
jgi:hypothetical protein